MTAGGDVAYPREWEADVVLSDGGTVHMRPIRVDDAERLVDFHSRLSPQTVYYRFFAPMPRLSERDVQRFTDVDYADRVALIALLGEDLVAVGRYDRITGSDEAEVAFVVRDDHQGRGLGSVLLEHLAAIARERGVRRFMAEVLPENRRMVRVFLDAGYHAERAYDDGVVRMSFSIEPTEASLEVMRSREHRAEARSIGRLLTPSSVAVVGASRNPASVGHTLLTNLLRSGFQGPVYPVNPAARHISSVRSYPSVLDIPDDVDLAVVATPAAEVPEVVAECARKGVRGLVVVSSGFAETGEEGRALERSVVEAARANGMRVIGPNCLGVMNTAPEHRLNATLAPVLPPRGRVGFFSQSGALGIAILESVAQRGLGLSTFVSAGNRADVSGNDLLQYWEDDPATDVVLLHLESFGNPRKFTRVARRLARHKPIVAVKSGRSASSVPPAHAGIAVPVPDRAVGALFKQAGVIRVATVAHLLDTAQLLAYQPLPAGRRVAIVGNSSALGQLAADACTSEGLVVVDGYPLDLGPMAGAGEFAEALGGALASDGVDALITVFIPPLTTPHTEVAEVLARVGRDAKKPIVTTFLGVEGVPERLRLVGPDGAATKGSIPSYRSPEAAVMSLARAARYVEWRSRPVGALPEIDDLDPVAARVLLDRVLAGQPEGRVLREEEIAALLGCYGITLWPSEPVGSAEEAVAAADRLGYPVVLKASSAALRHRTDLGGVRLDLAGPEAVRTAYGAMSGRQVLVQRMAPPGVATQITITDDPSFGALMSFGLSGVTTELLGDRAFRILPMTDVEAAELVRQPKASPILFGYRGADPVDAAALEDLLLRLSQLADDLPELAELELNPVTVAGSGLSVLGAAASVAPPGARVDAGPRRLR